MKRNMRAEILGLCCACALSGCFGSQPTPPQVHELAKADIDLFAARGFLGGSDYEHYTLKDAMLWRECGSLAPKPGSSTPDAVKNGPLKVQQKRLEALTADTQYPVIEALHALQTEATAEALAELPKPESVRSIRDGGVFEVQAELGGKHLSILTNMNTFDEPKTKLLQATKLFFERIRGRGPLICNAQTFFGVGRK